MFNKFIPYLKKTQCVIEFPNVGNKKEQSLIHRTRMNIEDTLNERIQAGSSQPCDFTDTKCPE
jgi:hypothetical protein